MKYILCQPAEIRFDWELAVCLTNLGKIGVDSKDVVLLFMGTNAVSTKYKKAGYDVHCYPEHKHYHAYPPATRPYLWWQYLKEDKRRSKNKFVYIDSDVIFRKKLDFRKIPTRDDTWCCSDCNGYLNLDYIRGCKNGNVILHKMASIVGVTIQSLETINFNSGGAQWVIKNPTAKYWHKVYTDSIKLWNYFGTIDSDIQAWTAEMWAQLWNMMYFNIGPRVCGELDFCWATDSIKDWSKTKIMHNAGVTNKSKNLFFKGAYGAKAPFDTDLSFVDQSKCSYKYVQAIKATRGDLIG